MIERSSSQGRLLVLALMVTLGAFQAPPTAARANEAPRPRPGVARNAWDEDLSAKQELDRHGAYRIGPDVVLWYPQDSLSDEQTARIVERLDRGIRAAKRFVGKPDWQVDGDRRVHFYCPATRFISHAPGGNCAFIPLWRMREDQSPWLHEAMHVLLATPKGDWLAIEDSVAMQRMPLWLEEGLADALAMQISEEEGLVYFSPLMDSRPERLDSLAAEALRRAPSDSVLAMIGSRGKLPQLFGPDRIRYAVPFYAGSASFTRFIARRYGYRPLLRAIEDFDHENETLAREMGEPIERVKTEWLAAIGYSPDDRSRATLPPQRSMDEMHGDCANFSWPMEREMRLFRLRATEVHAGVAAAHTPELRLDEPAAVTLARKDSVTLVATPGKAVGAQDAFSGLLVFTPREGGIYRVSAGSPLWIDAVVGGRSVPSERFEMQTQCHTIFKSIAFRFRAGEPVVLQITGSARPVVHLLVTPWR